MQTCPKANRNVEIVSDDVRAFETPNPSKTPPKANRNFEIVSDDVRAIETPIPRKATPEANRNVEGVPQRYDLLLGSFSLA